MFIGKKLTASEIIIQHELVHIRQKHSLDIIYFEIVKIICWFNPIVYLMQHSLKEVHEFIADNQIATTPKEVNHYTDFLISNAYGLPEMAMANNFFNKNLLKNRIMMLHQKRSGSLARLKYLVALPLLAGMLCLSTLGFTKDYKTIDIAPAKVIVTVKNTPKTQQNNFKMPPLPIGYPLRAVTSKGYKYQGSFLLVSKHDIDYEVIITEKDGSTKGYYRSTAKPSDIELLNHKYGYVFPSEPVQPQMPPPPPPTLIATTKKGYRFKQEGYVVNGKTDFKVSITDKNGEVKEYYRSKLASADLKMLSVKYGYTFPLAKNQVKFPPPMVVPDTKPKTPGKIRFPSPLVIPDKPVYDTTGRAAFEPLYKQLARTIRYPTEARNNLEQGRVFVIFNIDDNNKPYNFFIARGLSAAVNKEVLRAMANCVLPASVRKDVNYTIPISFSVYDNDKLADTKENTNIDTNPNAGLNHKALGYKTNLALNEVVVTTYSPVK